MQQKSPRRKSRMISMRMTEDQYAMISSLAQQIRSSTGFHITKASIMLKLMEYGFPRLMEEVKSGKLDEMSDEAG